MQLNIPTQTDPRAGRVFGVVILAAGASSRMGRPKLLLPWGTTSILGYLIEQWQRLGARQIAVVHAGGDSAIHRELDRLRTSADERVANPAPDRGMFSSIQCAAAWHGWNSELTHLAIALGDQPHLRDGTLRELVDFAAANPEKVCQPSRQGRRRHPVLLPRPVFERLKTCVATDLKQFLLGETVATHELDDPALEFDIDVPADYEKAVRLFLKP